MNCESKTTIELTFVKQDIEYKIIINMTEDIVDNAHAWNNQLFDISCNANNYDEIENKCFDAIFTLYENLSRIARLAEFEVSSYTHCIDESAY